MTQSIRALLTYSRRPSCIFKVCSSTPEYPYDQTFYDDLYSRLAVLKSRALSLSKYTIIVEQINNLKSQFDTFQKLDKQANTAVPGRCGNRRRIGNRGFRGEHLETGACLKTWRNTGPLLHRPKVSSRIEQLKEEKLLWHSTWAL